MANKLYDKGDFLRLNDESEYNRSDKYRSPFRRDLDRLVHSTAFRRLQGKTQLFPGWESDFFRNRLTHSLEVAQIAKSIAAKFNYEEKELKKNKIIIDLDLVEFAALAHDLGHPPFGHQGEEALDELMLDFGGFEGNAQTLRILTNIEKKGYRKPEFYENPNDPKDFWGLNISSRGLASIIKYDAVIPLKRQRSAKTKPLKACYHDDIGIIQEIKGNIIGHEIVNFKTIECSIMDIADDIAYSTYDLEDGLKAGFFSLTDLVFASYELRDQIADELNEKRKKTGNSKKLLNHKEVGNILQDLFREYLKVPIEVLDTNKAVTESDPDINTFEDLYYLNANIFHANSKHFSSGFGRSFLSSSLVNKFVNKVKFNFNFINPKLSDAYLDDDILNQVEVLKKLTFITQIKSSKLRIAEQRGKEIVKEIFNQIKEHDGCLLPEDFKARYDHEKEDGNKLACMRIICDFVACMTDRYAIEFYGRLKSENPETIFKPL